MSSRVGHAAGALYSSPSANAAFGTRAATVATSTATKEGRIQQCLGARDRYRSRKPPGAYHKGHDVPARAQAPGRMLAFAAPVGARPVRSGRGEARACDATSTCVAAERGAIEELRELAV